MEMIGQGTAIERLKAENLRAKRNVTETEQKSLSEKQCLARHLEMIEADMMEREAAFAQYKRDRMLLVETVDTSAAVAAEELDAAQNDAKRAHLQLTILQNEHTELLKRLAFAQESILERDRSIETLERGVADAESKLGQSELELVGRDESIASLKHGHSALEVELAAVVEEKRVFDVSLRSLKEDMGVVETSFRSMKNELIAKQDEIAKLQEQLKTDRLRRNDSSFSGVEGLKEIANIHTGSTTPKYIAQALLQYHAMETQTDGDQTDNGAAVVLPDSSALLDELRAQKLEMEDQLVETQRHLGSIETTIVAERESKLVVEYELIAAKEHLVDLEVRFQQLSQERVQLESAVEEQDALHRVEMDRVVSETAAQHQLSLERAVTEQIALNKAYVEQALAAQSARHLASIERVNAAAEVETRRRDDEEQSVAVIQNVTGAAVDPVITPVIPQHAGIETSVSELSQKSKLSMEAELSRLFAENQELQSRLGDLQRDSHMDIAKLKTKVSLGSILSET